MNVVEAKSDVLFDRIVGQGGQQFAGIVGAFDHRNAGVDLLLFRLRQHFRDTQSGGASLDPVRIKQNVDARAVVLLVQHAAELAEDHFLGVLADIVIAPSRIDQRFGLRLVSFAQIDPGKRCAAGARLGLRILEEGLDPLRRSVSEEEGRFRLFPQCLQSRPHGVGLPELFHSLGCERGALRVREAEPQGEILGRRVGDLGCRIVDRTVVSHHEAQPV